MRTASRREAVPVPGAASLVGTVKMSGLRRCARETCDRLVRPCVAYCCELCRSGTLREGMKPGVEEIAHSDACWRRHEERTVGPALRERHEAQTAARLLAGLLDRLGHAEATSPYRQTYPWLNENVVQMTWDEMNECGLVAPDV